MAELKWIKITTDIFDDEKIKIIEQMPEADTIIVIWFKLLSLAGKKNDSGLIYITKDVPYTDDSLPVVIGRNKQIVTLALQTFEKLGMIEIINDIITILNWDRHQNTEKIDKIREQNRIRQQKYRYGQKLNIGAICSYCGNKATGYDHIIPVTKNGKNLESNKIPCCISCNRIKNNHDLVYFLNVLLNNRNDDVILSNKILENIIIYDNNKNEYKYKDNVTVTSCHATDKNRKDKNRKDKNRLEKEYTSDFIEFWNIYPRKVDKKRAFKCWKARLKEYSDDYLIKAVKGYNKIIKDNKTELQYIKHPSTFLSKDTDFEDYIIKEPETKKCPKCGVDNFNGSICIKCHYIYDPRGDEK